MFDNLEFEDDDTKELREAAFADRMGVERWYYIQAIQAAVNFTLAAPVDPAARPWRQWGARNIGGRIRGFVQNPRNSRQIYAGSTQGGVFRSDDGGDTWHPLGQPRDSFPVGALAIAPSNPNILYVGTGEPAIIHDTVLPGPPPVLTGREAMAEGLGFFRYDATTGVFTNEVGPAIPMAGAAAGSANSYAAIAVDPANADRCWIASQTGLWRREPAGVRFRREPIPAAVPPVAPIHGACVSDVILQENWDPAQPATYRIFAAVAGWGIFRGVFNPNPAPAVAWDPILTGGLPAPAVNPIGYDRIRIASCKNYPNHLYAVYDKSPNHTIDNVYHSADGGNNWTALGALPNLGTQAWVNLCVAVHPDNPAIVIVGNVDVVRSLNFGVSWDTIIDWQNHTAVDRAQHGDNHILVFDSQEHNRLWIGSDGGVATAPDVVNVNPLTQRTWRKRSYGLCISQFNDITVHPNYPSMMGGGLQDNATYLTFGGPTWVLSGLGDGGQMCFEVNNPRQFVCPLQCNGAARFILQAAVTASSAAAIVPAPVANEIVRSPMADLPGTDVVVALQLTTPVVPGALAGLFVQTVLHHPVHVNNLMAGRVGDVMFSIDGGATYNPATSGIAGPVDALAYGPGATVTASDWWIGSRTGIVRLGTGAVPKAWATVTPPAVGGLAGIAITSIAVHPNNANYVAVATGGNALAGGANIAQGRVFLTHNRGANWMEITGLAGAFVIGTPPGAPVGPRTALPPCPISSVVFDASAPAAGPQVLYAATLAGVFVIRNLPPLPAGPPPPIANPAPFNPNWRSFNGVAAAPLPLTMVNDLEIVQLPARPGAIANSPESMLRVRLYAAMFGRGIFACDISPAYPPGVPQGGPGRRLFMRQHGVEDGLAYPRPLPALLNTAPAAPNYNTPQFQGDPRQPAIANPVPVPLPPGAFTDLAATDIRVDNAPFRFFDETLDGVEFDEELRSKTLVPGQLNVVYVQVHNAGWDSFAQPLDVHLYFAPGAAPAAVADPNPLPDLHDNFWTNFTADPLPAPTGTLAATEAAWQRAGKKQTIAANRLSANYPAVVRFEWTPPAAIGAFAALLAVVSSPEDALPAAAAMPRVMRTLLRNERRAAFRLVAVNAYVPDVYIRDSPEDTGIATSGSFAGRSPDIIVVQIPVADPKTTFADLFDTHNGDRIRPGQIQSVFVRIHNRRNVEVQATVDLFWSKPNAATSAADPHAPGFDGSTWTRVTPVGTATIPVPASAWGIAQINWFAADVPPLDVAPGAFNAIGFIAIVSSADGATDPAPANNRVHDPASFWAFFRRTMDSNNAAYRAVLYGD